MTGASAQVGARVEQLWRAVLAGDEYAATDAVLDAVAEGVDDETVLLDVIGAVQRRVGAEWATNTLTVAQEHTATAINERVIGALRHRRRPDVRHGRITVACVDGEWHSLPARLLAEVLVLRGFRVDYLGAQVPAPHLIEHLHRTGPDAVAISGSIATRLPTAHATITACAATGTPVIAGGGAFGPDGRFARLLGAQAWAPDARSAADRLAAGPLPHPGDSVQRVDQLPHLADQEYTMVSRAMPRLVRSVYRSLERLVPGMAEYGTAQRERTAEDLRHIVEFLATALYVDDDPLFADFLGWTADVLAARGVPGQVLLPTIDLFCVELRDFPRASRLLSHGHARLLHHLSTPSASETA